MKDDYKILIADGDKSVREQLTNLLSKSFYVEAIDNGNRILNILNTHDYDILILDLQLSGINGIDILKTINRNKINIAVVVITASNDVNTAIISMKLGVYDYLVKPFDTDKLLVILKNIVEKLDLENELNKLREQVGENFRFKNIIGKSPVMQRVFLTLEKVIDTDSTILIIGDSGTGKEIIAKAVHYNSNRKQYPFRSIDCSTIPQDLIGSELFGHEKGSFTGAISRKIGKFEIANKGTLFLDEVSNISIDMQAKLLRVIQEKEFERIGGTQLIKVNTRIVAASNRDLRDLVKENKFREDLYYRLNVVPIYLPQLKDRKEDIPLFIDLFLERYNTEYGKDLNIDINARLVLTNYQWPGNVRQLENFIKRLILLSTNKNVDTDQIKNFLDFEEFQPGIEYSKSIIIPKFESEFIIKTLDEIEHEYLERALRHFNYNISSTAKALNISRKTMHNKLKKYNIVINKAIR